MPKIENIQAQQVHVEDRRNRILDNLTEGCQIIDFDWKYLYVNKAAAAHGNQKKENLIGSKIMTVYPGIEHTDLFRVMCRCMENREEKIMDNEFEYPDGDRRWFGLTIQPDPEGIFIKSIDITESRKEKEMTKWNSERNELLSMTASKLLKTGSPQSLIEELCGKMMEFLDCQAFFNFMVNPEQDCLYLNACAGIPIEEKLKIGRLDYGVAVCGCAARDRKIIIAEDIYCSEDPTTELVKSYGIQAYCCHPMIIEDRLIGTLSFGSRTRPRFSLDDIKLMKEVSNLVAIAMDRIQKEETLRGKNARLQSYFDLPLAGIAITSPEKGWLEVSPGLCIMLGYSAEELSLMNWSEITHPDDLDADVAQFDRVLSGEINTYAIAKRFIRKNRDIIWTSLSVACVRKLDNSVDYFIALLQDITDLKSAEEALHQREKDLKRSQRISRLGSWRLDLKTNQVEWTEELYRMYGFDPALPPPPYTEHVKLFTPESWKRLSTALDETSKRGMPYELELETTRGNGNNGWMWVYGEAEKDADDNIIRLWGAAQDITDRKQIELALRESEEKFRNFTEQSFVGFYIIEDGLLKYVNPKFAELFGYTVDECLDGMHVRDLVHPEDLATVQEQIRRRVTGEIDTVQYKLRGVNKNGKTIHLEVYGSSLMHKGRSVAIGALLDITKELEMEKRIFQSQRMESIGTLAGGIAHDFNNILFPIIGMAEMLIDDLPEGSIERENVEEIYRAGRRGQDLVKQILAFSRQSEHMLIPTRIQNILKEVLNLSRASIPSYIEIDQNIQQNSGLVIADPSQIHQIGMNLITNAYHAVEKSGGNISVRLYERVIMDSDSIGVDMKSGKYVVLSVSDTGHGMSKEIMQKIFDPYFTTKEQGKGTGLGLATVYGIVKEHKGYIDVHSKIGKGSTFDIYLPLMPGSETAGVIDVIEKYQGGDERILLVDDEESVVKIEKKMLEGLGYAVTARLHSFEALETFKANPYSFDLVITDMTMPCLLGTQLAEKILSVRADMPIIICTGFSERVNGENVQSVGASAVIMKPVLKSKLAETIRKVLDQKK
jgi:PAS domain S-box-containing protein